MAPPSRSKTAGAAAPRKITLARKSQSELKQASTQGRARTVNVEVRHKKTYIKRDVLEEQNKQTQDEADEKRKEQEAAGSRRARAPGSRAQGKRAHGGGEPPPHRRRGHARRSRPKRPARAQEEARAKQETEAQRRAAAEAARARQPARPERHKPEKAPVSRSWIPRRTRVTAARNCTSPAASSARNKKKKRVKERTTSGA